jgi:hypothetical protein
MSTKTTIKRVALVAVAALGIGLLPTQGALAAPGADSVTLASAASSTTVAATAITNKVTTTFIASAAGETITATAVLLSAPVASTSVVYGFEAGSETGVTNADVALPTSTVFETGSQGAGRTTGTALLEFSADAPGTYVIRVTPSGGLNTTAITWTITVADYPSVDLSKSTSIRNVIAGVAGVAPVTDNSFASDQTIYATKGTFAVGQTAVASVEITQLTSTSAAVNATKVGKIVATVSGPGTLELSNSNTPSASSGRSIELTPSSNVAYLHVFNDGTNGVATITITIGGKAFATETINFYGAPATITATQNLKVAPMAGAVHGCSAASCAGTSIATTAAAVVKLVDDKAIAVPFATVTGLSSDTTLFSSTIGATETTTWGTFNTDVTSLEGTVSGKSATMTYRVNLGTASAPVYVSSNALTFSVGGAPSTATLNVAAGPNIGDKGSFAINLKDSAGNAPFDSQLDVDLISNIAFVSTATWSPSNPNTTVLFIGGTSGSVDFYNPLVQGNVVVTGLAVYSATNKMALSSSWSVSNPTLDAAADAATEAIDAANAATDAANAAAEAADAATAAAQDAADAVAALSTQVAEMINALKKQITALTNLVIKIQKKVKA